MDPWTRGPVDSFFLYFTKMQKRSIAALDMILLVALPRLTRKKDLTYFLSFVLYNIYSLRINQGQGVSVDVGLFFSYRVSGNIDLIVSKIKPRLQVNRVICIRKHFVGDSKIYASKRIHENNTNTLYASSASVMPCYE